MNPSLQARELVIKARLKTNPFAIVSAGDFQLSSGGAIDVHVVLEQPNLSLYCLDHARRQALFVETPPE